jgi:hypothetical protein
MSEILGTLFKYLLSLLGVGAVVLILYQVFGANKTQNAISDITQMQANITSLYNGRSNFTTLTTAVAIAAKLAPSDMISGSALTNPWGGVVTPAVNGTLASNFDVTETLVPSDACAKMIVGLPTLVTLKVNGAGVTLPADAGTAATACAVAANPTMVFTFSH